MASRQEQFRNALRAVCSEQVKNLAASNSQSANDSNSDAIAIAVKIANLAMLEIIEHPRLTVEVRFHFVLKAADDDGACGIFVGSKYFDIADAIEQETISADFFQQVLLEKVPEVLGDYVHGDLCTTTKISGITGEIHFTSTELEEARRTANVYSPFVNQHAVSGVAAPVTLVPPIEKLGGQPHVRVTNLPGGNPYRQALEDAKKEGDRLLREQQEAQAREEEKRRVRQATPEDFRSGKARDADMIINMMSKYPVSALRWEVTFDFDDPAFPGIEITI